MTTAQTEARRLCRRCAHYFVTHDPVFQHGCRAMNFKGARMPGLEVLETSGDLCLLFQQKIRGTKANDDG